MKVYKTDGFYNSMDEVPSYYLEADGMPKPLTGGGNYKVFFPGSRKIIDLNGDGKISDADQYYAASPPSRGIWRFYQRDYVEAVRFECYF